MNRIVLAAAALALAGCPSPPAGKNPPQVWEALNGSELMVKLSPIEPAPF